MTEGSSGRATKTRHHAYRLFLGTKRVASSSTSNRTIGRWCCQGVDETHGADTDGPDGRNGDGDEREGDEPVAAAEQKRAS